MTSLAWDCILSGICNQPLSESQKSTRYRYEEAILYPMNQSKGCSLCVPPEKASGKQSVSQNLEILSAPEADWPTGTPGNFPVRPLPQVCFPKTWYIIESNYRIELKMITAID